MTSVLTEVRHSGGFLVSEANGHRARDAGTYTNSSGSDIVVQAGTVLALAAEGVDATTAAGTNTGNGTIGSLSFGATAKLGVYTIKLTSSSAFTVTDPTGDALPAGTVGTAYTDAELGFTVTAGGTAFVANDSFTITASAADARYVNWTNAAPASAILYNTLVVPASSTIKVTVVTRAAEVNAAHLVYDAAITGSSSPTPAQLYAIAAQQLRNVGIIAR